MAQAPKHLNSPFHNRKHIHLLGLESRMDDAAMAEYIAVKLQLGIDRLSAVGQYPVHQLFILMEDTLLKPGLFKNPGVPQLGAAGGRHATQLIQPVPHNCVVGAYL